MHNMQNMTVFTICKKNVCNNMLINMQYMQSMSLIQYAEYVEKYVKKYAQYAKQYA